MHVEFIIREAMARDISAMAGLLSQLFAIEDDFTFNEHKQRHGLAALMADHGRSIIKIAESHHTVIGMCSAQIVISTAEGGMSALVEDMIVDAAWRNRGVGSALLAAVTAWASDRQCLRMQLLADHRNNVALDFYRGAGWHPTNLVGLNRKIFVDHLAEPESTRHAPMSARR